MPCGGQIARRIAFPPSGVAKGASWPASQGTPPGLRKFRGSNRREARIKLWGMRADHLQRGMESKMFHEQDAADGKARILVQPPDGLSYKVVASYLENCRKGLQPLKDAIGRADYEFAGVYGHHMKGCGAAYGFPQLTETGASIEQAARIRNDTDLRTCAAALEEHLASVEVVEV
jgi:HPt (histidine-containing phosphotransfer) domain-containing protein